MNPWEVGAVMHVIPSEAANVLIASERDRIHASIRPSRNAVNVLELVPAGTAVDEVTAANTKLIF
jgi:hypothetical protein